MLKQVISGYNALPGAPAGWNPETDGDCGALPIRVTHKPDGSVAPLPSPCAVCYPSARDQSTRPAN